MNTIFFIIILIFILYYMYNYPKNKEDFDTSTLTPNEITVIKNLSPHLSAIKNLSDLATLLMKGSLTIPGGLNITGDANITGKTNMKSDANIKGNANITGDAIITGGASIKSGAIITGKTNITGDTNIIGFTNISKDLGVAGTMLIGNKLIIGNTTITESQLINLLAGKFANITSDTIDCPSIKIGESKFVPSGDDKYAINLKNIDDAEKDYYIQFRTNDTNYHSAILLNSTRSYNWIKSDITVKDNWRL